MKILKTNQYSIFTSILLLLFSLSDKFGLFILTPIIKKSIILALMMTSFLFIIVNRNYINLVLDKKLFTLLVLLFIYSLYSLLMYNLQYSPTYSLVGFFYYNLKSTILILIIYLLISNKKFIYSSLELIVYFGVFISISSIIYLILKTLNITPLFPYIVDGSIQYSLLFFGNYRDELRLVYYFSEPSKYATFLVLPFFLSLSYYQMTHKKKYKYFSYLIIFNIIFTFSFAVIFALFTVFLIYKILNIKSYFLKLFAFFIFIIVIITILYLSYIYLSTNYFNLSGAFNKSISFKARLNLIEASINLIKQYPYGIGLLPWSSYNNISYNNIKSFGIIIVDNLVRGGYIYLFLYLIICIFILNILLQATHSLDYLEKYLSMATLTIFIAIQIYGPLEQRLFLVSLILYIYRKYYNRKAYNEYSINNT